MSDDIKVKFSGDFTDVSKGAADASKRAGTAMSAWVGEYTKSLKESLVSTLALGSIIGGFISNIKATVDRFKEIDSMSRKLGVSRVELQQFSKLGKEFNIDMDTMARTIAFANKVIGGAALGNKDAQKSLMELGYTQNQVTAGNITAISVIQKLTENYEKNKKEHGDVIAQNILSKQSTEIFGRAGQDLIPIIKEGTEALKERIKTMQIYSDAEIKAGARMSRQYEKGKAKWDYHTGGKQLSEIGYRLDQADLDKIEQDFLDSKGVGHYESVTSGNPMSDIIGRLSEKTGVSKKDLNKEYFDFLKAKAKEKGWDMGDLSNVLQDKALTNSGVGQFWSTKNLGDKAAGFYLNMASRAENAQADIDKAEKAAAANTLDLTAGGGSGNVPVLAASSLQQIGGGDIASVSGLYHGNVEDYTRRTAEATEKMVSQDTPAAKKITSVAK